MQPAGNACETGKTQGDCRGKNLLRRQASFSKRKIAPLPLKWPRHCRTFVAPLPLGAMPIQPL
jgi:hypothetical protein